MAALTTTGRGAARSRIQQTSSPASSAASTATPHAASAVLGLQAALVVAAASEDHTTDPIDEAYAVDGGGHFPPASIALGGEGIAVLELARRAPWVPPCWLSIGSRASGDKGEGQND